MKEASTIEETKGSDRPKLDDVQLNWGLLGSQGKSKQTR